MKGVIAMDKELLFYLFWNSISFIAGSIFTVKYRRLKIKERKRK
jgi:hypothetical protein